MLAILNRIMRRVARRLAVGDIDEEAGPILAQVQAEAATTWPLPTDGKPKVERLRACRVWFSLHAGAGIAEHDWEALERVRTHEPLHRLPGR